MNWDDAVEAHVQWKITLQTYLDGGGGKLDPSVIERDNVCPLGKWIYQEELRLHADPTYQALKNNHAAFHEAAAEVVRKANSGDKAGAQALMSGGTAFMILSLKVTESIAVIRNMS